jgi:hypothetical protein
MLQFSDLHKRNLIVAAGILYTLSLHKYVSRDALSMQTGVQGPVEFGLICLRERVCCDSSCLPAICRVTCAAMLCGLRNICARLFLALVQSPAQHS